MEEDALSPGLWGDHDGLRKDIAAFRRQIQEAGLDVGLASTLESYADDAEVAFGERNYYGEGGVRELLEEGRAELQRVMPHSAVPISVAHPGPPSMAESPRPVRGRSHRRVAAITGIITIAVVVGLAALASAIHLFNPSPGPMMSMTESQVIKSAGLPPNYVFVTDLVDNMTVSDLDPDMLLWTDPSNVGRQNGHTVISATAPVDNPESPDYGPLGFDQLLVFKRGDTLEGVYFPDACGSPVPLGRGKVSGKAIPIRIVRRVPNTCG